MAYNQQQHLRDNIAVKRIAFEAKMPLEQWASQTVSDGKTLKERVDQALKKTKGVRL